jgi:hypothetical protein
MASPRPVPPFSRLVVKNGSPSTPPSELWALYSAIVLKILFMISPGIPGCSGAHPPVYERPHNSW